MQRYKNAANSTQKIEQARKILSDMGVQIDNTFNRDETAKNNEVQRNETVLNGKVSRGATTAQVTGQIPKGMQYSSNPFFDDNGNPIEDIDYKKVIEQAIARGDTQTAQAARVARGVKIWNNYSKYGQYDDGDYGVPNTQTEDARQFDAQIKNSTDLAKMGYEHEERMPGIEADNTIRVNTNQADNTIRVNDASAKNDMDVANNASKNTLAENISATNNAVNAYKQTNGAIGGSSSGGSSKPALSLSEVNDAIANGNITPGVVDAYNYYNQTGYTIENFPGSSEDDSGADYDSKIDSVYNSSSSTVQSYIRNRLKPLLQSRSITEDELKNDLLSNSANYDLEVDDMKAICNALDVNSMWVDNYKNKGVFGWEKELRKNNQVMRGE